MKHSISIFLPCFLYSCGTTQFQSQKDQVAEKPVVVTQTADAVPQTVPVVPQTALPDPEVTPVVEADPVVAVVKTEVEEPPVIVIAPEVEEEEEVVEVEEEEDSDERIVVNKGKLSITFLDETAGFQNSLGYYEISDAGEIINTKIIWNNASHSSDHLSAEETTLMDGPLKVGDTFFLGEIEKKTRISFFLVADGYRENNWTDATADNYIDPMNGQFEFRTTDNYDMSEPALLTSESPYLFYTPNAGEPVLLQTKTDIDADIGVNSIYHAAYDAENSLNLNPDGFNHIQHQEVIPGRKWSIGVEDLLHSPDRADTTFDGDFMDLTFTIQFDP